jgi:AcrR family transcriptional regulator
MTTTRPRLAATDRRAALIEAALAVFSARSYRGATTAEIARAAGVTEPILYRHFGSKRELFLACLDESWARLRQTIEDVVASEPDAREWASAVPRALALLRARKLAPTQLFLQALSEATEDTEVRRYLRRHLAEMHDYVEDLLRRAQEAGGVLLDRDASAEAWIGLGLGLLRSVHDLFGGVLREEDFAAISASRSRWLTGRQ